MSTNLIVAIVFAGLFGTAFIWLAVYYIYRYIHLRCLELDHWFHVITPPAWRSACRHCEGTGKAKEKRRSSSRRRRGRSMSRGRRDKAEHDGEQRTVEADTEWNVIGRDQQPRRNFRQALPGSSAAFSPGHGGEQQYNPWQGQVSTAQQLDGAYRQPAKTFQQPFQQPWHQNATSFAMPAPMPQRQKAFLPIPVASSVSSMPAYPKPLHKAYTERPEPQANRKSASKERVRVHRTDYIYKVDDYPPIVKEGLMKAARTQISSPSSSSSSSSSSSTSSAEEVPRASIPRTAPRFTERRPVQFQQHPFPQLASRTWEVPTSHARQLGSLDQAR